MSDNNYPASAHINELPNLQTVNNSSSSNNSHEMSSQINNEQYNH